MHFVVLTPHTTHAHRTHTPYTEPAPPYGLALPLCCPPTRLTTPVGRCACYLLLRGAGHPPGPPHASHNPRTIYNNHPHPLCGARSELRLGTCSCSRSEGGFCLKLLLYTFFFYILLGFPFIKRQLRRFSHGWPWSSARRSMYVQASGMHGS